MERRRMRQASSVPQVEKAKTNDIRGIAEA
jgi:hypothetical protein